MQTIYYSWPFWAYFREFSSLIGPEDSYTILLSRFDLRVPKKDLTACSIRAEQKIDAFPPFDPCFLFRNVVVITIIHQLLQIVRPSKEKQLKFSFRVCKCCPLHKSLSRPIILRFRCSPPFTFKFATVISKSDFN
jgi:hypothetical protein